jgi:hypothetical protein
MCFPPIPEKKKRGSYNRENAEKENISRIEKYMGLKKFTF